MTRFIAAVGLAFGIGLVPARADIATALRQCLFEAVTTELQRTSGPGTLSPNCSGEAAREVWNQMAPYGSESTAGDITTLKFGPSSFCLRQKGATEDSYACTLGLDLDEPIRRRAVEECSTGC